MSFECDGPGAEAIKGNDDLRWSTTSVYAEWAGRVVAPNLDDFVVVVRTMPFTNCAHTPCVIRRRIILAPVWARTF